MEICPLRTVMVYHVYPVLKVKQDAYGSDVAAIGCGMERGELVLVLSVHLVVELLHKKLYEVYPALCHHPTLLACQAKRSGGDCGVMSAL